MRPSRSPPSRSSPPRPRRWRGAASRPRRRRPPRRPRAAARRRRAHPHARRRRSPRAARRPARRRLAVAVHRDAERARHHGRARRRGLGAHAGLAAAARALDAARHGDRRRARRRHRRRADARPRARGRARDAVRPASTRRCAGRRARSPCPGRFAFDAIAPDARRMFLIEQRPGGHYLVRNYDLVRDELMPGAVSTSASPTRQMEGQPVARAVPAAAPWVYTLYRKAEGPFVHALNTEGFALCIDLPAAARSGRRRGARVGPRPRPRRRRRSTPPTPRSASSSRSASGDAAERPPHGADPPRRDRRGAAAGGRARRRDVVRPDRGRRGRGRHRDAGGAADAAARPSGERGRRQRAPALRAGRRGGDAGCGERRGAAAHADVGAAGGVGGGAAGAVGRPLGVGGAARRLRPHRGKESGAGRAAAAPGGGPVPDPPAIGVRKPGLSASRSRGGRPPGRAAPVASPR